MVVSDQGPKTGENGRHENDVNSLIDPITVVAQIKCDLFLKGPHALARNAAAALKIYNVGFSFWNAKYAAQK